MGIWDTLSHAVTRTSGSYVRTFENNLRKSAVDPFHPNDGRYLINLSFDAKLCYTVDFWKGGIDESLAWVEDARSHFPSLLEYLSQSQLPHTIYIVAALLDADFARRPIVPKLQAAAIADHPECFTLSGEEITYLRNSSADIGIHGLTGRPFPALTKEEAHGEIVEAGRIVSRIFNRFPRSMSFPDNELAHIDVLAARGIQSWRSNRERVLYKGELPMGLQYDENHLDAEGLRAALKLIRKYRPGYVLSLWSTLGETDSSMLMALATIAIDEGFEFTTAREYVEL